MYEFIRQSVRVKNHNRHRRAIRLQTFYLVAKIWSTRAALSTYIRPDAFRVQPYRLYYTSVKKNNRDVAGPIRAF